MGVWPRSYRSRRAQRLYRSRQQRAHRMRFEQLEPRMLLTAAALDQRFPGEIAVPGEVDSFTIEVFDNQRVSLSVDTSPSGTPHLLGGASVAIRDPADQLLMEADMLNGDPRVRDLVLSPPGLYTIEVRAPSEAPERVGSYELHVADRDPAPRPIQFGQSLAGALDVRDRIQLFDLEVGEDQLGAPFTIVVNGDQAVHPVLELFSPEGSLIVNGASGTNVFDTRIADFTARATDQGGFGTGIYQIRATAFTDALGYFELGVSDRPLESSRHVELGTFVPGHLNHLADENLYAFAALAGDVVTVSIAGTGFTPDLLLTGPGGFTSGTGDFDTFLRPTLPADGTYQILVGGGGAASVGHGAYLLGLSHPRPVPRQIAFGERATGEIAVPGDFADFRLIVGEQQVGRPVSIVVSDVSDFSSGAFQARLEVYSPDGTRLRSEDSAAYWYGARIDDLVLSAAGEYTIRVSEQSDADTGSFLVGVSDQPIATPTLLPAFNAVVSGQIAPAGDVDEYRFAGTAGQIVTVEQLGDEPFDLALYHPDGQVLAGEGDFDTLLDQVTLPEDGTYVVRIWGRGGTYNPDVHATGDYSFAVWTPNRSPEPVEIGVGESLPGRVNVRGDLVDYRLVVSEQQVGRPVSIVVSDVSDFSSGAFQARLEVYSPDGTRLRSEDSAAYWYGARIDDLLLSAAGEYTIRVSEQSDADTGSFLVGVSDQPIATPMPLPAFNAAISGQISPAGDVDEYHFVGTAGQIVTIEQLEGGPFDLTLYRPDGQVLVGEGGFDTLLEQVTLPEDGTYVLRIWGRGGTSYPDVHATGDYRFAVWTPNRNPEPVGIGFGQSVPGRVDVRGDLVDYRLVVDEQHVGRPVSIVVSDVSNVSSGSFQARLEVYDPDGTQLRSEDSAAYFYGVRIRDLVLPAAGEYTIRVSERYDAHTGSFTVGVSDQPGSVPMPVAIGSKTAGLLGPYGDVDEYQVISTTGQTINVDVTAAAELDTDLFVLHPDGRVLAQAASGNDSSLSFTPEVGVMYTVQIVTGGEASSPNIPDRGVYLLEVSDTANPAAYPDGAGAAIALEPGQSRAGTIGGPSDTGQYTFAGPRGDVVRITVATGRDRSTTLRADVRIFGPGGMLLASSTSSTQADFKDFVLPADGPYRIEVTGRGSDVGPYVVGISDRSGEARNPAHLAPGQVVARSLFPLADEDVYRFTYAAGEIVKLAAHSSDTSQPIEMLVFSPIGSLLHQRSGTTAVFGDGTLPEAGEYTVLIRAVNPVVTDYLLEFTARPAGTPAPPTVLPGEPSAPISAPIILPATPVPTAVGEPPTLLPPLPSAPPGFDEFGPMPLAYGEVVIGQFPSGRGAQTFEAPLVAGEVLNVSVRATERFDSDLHLFDPDGILIVSSTAGVNSAIDGLTASKTGTYRLIVSGSGGGGFALSASKRFGVGSITGAELRLDAPRTTAVFEFAAQEHIYQFEALQPTIVNLSAVPVNGSLLDARMTLIGPQGQVVTMASSGTSSTLSNLLVHGTYLVIVRPEAPAGGQGAYSIGLTTASPPTISPSPAAAIEFGQSVTGSISAAGDDFQLSLTVTEQQVGRPVSIVVSDVSDISDWFQARLEVYGPDGTQLRSEDSAAYWYGVRIRDLVLSVAGEYTIRVSEQSDTHTGSFTVGVSDQPIATPTLLPAFNAAIGGQIAPAGNVDEYRFVGTAGQIVTVEQLDGAPFDLTLYRPDGQVLFGAGNFDTLLDRVTLPEDGTYVLRIWGRGGTSHPDVHATGDYSIAVWTPNRSPEPVEIGFGESLPGRVNVRGDLVEYRLVVNEQQVGRPVSIVVSDVSDVSSGSFQTRLEVYSPDGTQLRSEDSAAYWYGVRIRDLVLPVAGEYTIRVSERNDADTGSFLVGVSDQPVTTPTLLPAFNAAISGQITPVGDVDAYRFVGTAGQIVTVELLEGGPFELTLYRPGGQVLAGAGDFDTLLDRVTLPEDGTYVVRIWGRGGTSYPDVHATGDYSFAVWTPNRSPVPVEIGFGESLPGHVNVRGDLVEYRLVVDEQQAGRPVSIVVSDVSDVSSGAFQARLEVYGPDGTRLRSEDSAAYFYGVRIRDLVLPVAGEYTIRVSERSDAHTGSFTVGVSDQPIATPTPLPAFNAAIGGQLSPAGDVDEYRFAGTAGQIVTVEQLGFAPVDFTLYRPDGQVLAGEGDFDTLLDRVTLPEDGTYVVRIWGRGGTSYPDVHATGDYSFAVWTPNRSPAPVEIDFGQSLPGRVNVRGDLVEYRLVVNEQQVGRPVSVAVSDVSDFSSGAFQARLEVYGPDGTRLRSEDSAAYFYGVRIRDLVLPVAGEYTIRVSERSDAHTGSFTVGVSDQPVAAGTEPIVPDAEALSRSLSPLGDVDRFVFEALRGQAFNILVTSLTDSIDLDALVIDSLGAIRASQIGGRHAMIANFVAPADDVYVIQVQPGGEATGVNVARTGDYTIELQRILVSPNLRVASVTPPSGSGIKSGDSVTISWTVENAGNAGTGDSSWTDRVVISPNPTLGDADDIVLGTFVRDGALAPGEDYTATHVVTLPQGIGGDFFVIVEADSGNAVLELFGEDDNVRVSATTFRIALAQYPDLVVEDLTVLDAHTVTWKTANRGNATAQGGWQERIVITHLTTQTVLRNEDITLSGDLAPGATVGNQFAFTPTQPGRYLIQVTTDSRDTFFEVNAEGHEAAEANNSAETQFVIPGADLIVTSFNVPGNLLIGNPATAEVTWTVTNQGQAAPNVSQWIDRVVFSTDAVIGNFDDIVAAEFVRADGLGPGDSYTQTQTVTLPADRSGQFFLYVVTDAANVVIEPDGEENNTSGLQAINVTVPYADLVVEAVTAPSEAHSGDQVILSWGVRNEGNNTTNVADWVDRIVLSADDVLDVDDLELAIISRSGVLAPGASYAAEATVQLPHGIAGEFHVFVLADFTDAVFEFVHEDNNAGRTLAPVSVTLRPAPNLVVTSITSPAEGQPQQTVTVGWTVENIGPGVVEDAWVDHLYLSPDGSLNGAILLVTVSRAEALESGASYTVSRSFALPTLADGSYRFLVVSDAANAVFEEDEDDNVRVSGPLQVGHADLAAAITAAPDSAVSCMVIPLEFTVTNVGTAPALGTWVDRIYLSSDPLLSADDRLLAERAHAGPLAASASYTELIDVLLPPDIAGAVFLILVTDTGDTVFEPEAEGNNTAHQSITIELAPYADLVASDVVAPALTIGDPAEVTVSWTVTNQGTGAGRSSSWTDRVYVSQDDVAGNGDDELLAEYRRDGALEVGASYRREESIRLPFGFEGRYTLFVTTDALEEVFENQLEANNTAWLSGTFAVAPRSFSDLTITDVQAPATAAGARVMTISWTVKNQGLSLTDQGSWTDIVQLSRDAEGTEIVTWPGTPYSVLASVQHTGALSAGAAYTVAADILLPPDLSGTYYVKVTTGGPYEFVFADNNSRQSAAVEVTQTPPADLLVEDIVAPLSAQSGSAIDVSWRVRNVGLDSAVGNWVDQVYLREAGNPLAPAILLGTFTFEGPLAAGTSYMRSELLRLPANLHGTYRAEVRTNVGQRAFEGGFDENNTLLDDQLLTVGLPDRPDLQVESIVAPASANAGGMAALEFTVINQGTASASGRWTDAVYLSLDNRLSSDDLLLAQAENGAALAPGERYTTTLSPFPIPKRWRGDVFFIVVSDFHNVIEEFPQEENNTTVRPIHVIPFPAADLLVSDVVAPAQVFDGAEIEVRFRVTNCGLGPTDTDSWLDSIWLTRDKNRPHAGGPGNEEDYLLLTLPHDGTLTIGQFYEVTAKVRLPERLAGEWHITPWVDVYDVVFEETTDIYVNPDDPNELDNNNYKARPITILSTPPDLVVHSIEAADQAVSGQALNVRWTVKNQGTGPTLDQSWSDRVVLASHADLQQPNVLFWHLTPLVGGRIVTRELDVDDTYTIEEIFVLSPEARGSYLIVFTGEGAWEGPFDNNNTLVRPIQVTTPAADLQVVDVEVSPDLYSGETATVSWTVKNFGDAVWEGTRFWREHVYISRDPVFIPHRASLLGEFLHINDSSLGTGESYTSTQEVTLPAGIGGDYYLHVITDPPTGPLLYDNDWSRQDYEGGRQGRGIVFEGWHCIAYPDCDDSLERNNAASLRISVEYREPNLVVSALQVPQNEVSSGQEIEVSWTVANIGTRGTRQSGWFDRVYLSRDGSLDARDWLLRAYEVDHSSTKGLAAGSEYSVTLRVQLPEGIEGSFQLLVFTDANLVGSQGADLVSSELRFEYGVDSILARVPEFLDEGDNVRQAPLNVKLTPPPDLRVTSITAPDRVTSGQLLSFSYTVTNAGAGDTPANVSDWSDLVYLSRDPLLDLKSDRYLTSLEHTGGLSAGDSYQRNVSVRAPRDLQGPFYLFVVTDPAQPYAPRGNVFELDKEHNNATYRVPQIVLELPPPADLQVQSVTIPSDTQSGETIHVSWTVINADDDAPALGSWTDAVYLSTDATWDLGDRLIGRITADVEGLLPPGASYTSSLEAVLPPAKPGSYYILVRPDIFDEVYEAGNEANNQTASADTFNLTVSALQLGVPLQTTLSAGQNRLYAVQVGLGETLRVRLTSGDKQAANEIFLRFGDVPTGTQYDAAYQGPLAPDQTAVIPSTQPGTYYLLVRNHALPQDEAAVTLLAELLPFSITDVVPDTGGDSRWVTTTVLGARFHPQAIVKLVRPGFAEYEPANYRVVDSTRIIATFDLGDAPHGLYDLKVINPGGVEAVIPYRYLVERAVEPDVAVAMGGPRVLAPGNTGTYSLSVRNLTNVDAPYVHLTFGIPELGHNSEVYNFRYVTFASNLGGAPDAAALNDLPWASLDSALNTTGNILASGYALDLPTRQFTGLTFNAHTYPGLKELAEQKFDALRSKIYEQYPEYRGLLDDGPEGLALIDPLLLEIFNREGGGVLDPDMCDEIAFTFHITAAATALTREEFIKQQSSEALRLRAAVLSDPMASQALAVLAADRDQWVAGYLAALEQAGILRSAEGAPPIREQPKVLSLAATLASGLLLGSAGRNAISQGNILQFFSQIRQWYGHEPDMIGSSEPPDASLFNLGFRQPTHFESFRIYVPYGQCRVDIPPGAEVRPPDFDRFLTLVGGERAARLVGPFGFGAQQFVPVGQRLPYTVEFENPATAASHSAEIRVVTKLDPHLDARSFRLGGLKVGDIQVHIPAGRGAFQGDFDFTQSKGFVLRVSAGLDVQSGTASWLLQAIDPLTGELLQDPANGLLTPNNPQGHGAGLVSYSVLPVSGVATGTRIQAQARVLLDNVPPQDSSRIHHTIDAAAPTTTLTSAPFGLGGTEYLVQWQATDDAQGSGVQHVTVYVAENGGDFRIWLRQSTDKQALFKGEPGASYEFLALATDNAGNREQPPLGVRTPEDGAAANLGTLPDVGETTPVDMGEPPAPGADPATNPVFVEAAQGILMPQPGDRAAEFQTVLHPFTARAFATGFVTSGAGIGPTAIVALEDGGAIVVGGPARNQLYRLGRGGGEIDQPLATLPHPVYDLALAPSGSLWAATGGGPLLRLNPDTGSVLGQFGEGLTQSVAVHPQTGAIYVSSGRGIEVFDPAAERFTHFSDVRVGSLAFTPEGELWAAIWPQRGDVVRFDQQGRPQVMLRYEAPVDSIAFGQTGTPLESLLFVSQNAGTAPGSRSEFTMVDMATLQRVAVATGGTRGDVVRTTSDGRILLSQSHQVDLIAPLFAPRVVATNPPDEAIVALPRGGVSVTFDQGMFEGDANDVESVVNPNNFSLIGDRSGNIPVQQVLYDRAGRTVLVVFDALPADTFTFTVEGSVRNAGGLRMGDDFVTQFVTVTDFSDLVDMEFVRVRANRASATVGYDVTITNRADNNLVLPLMLVLDPAHSSAGSPAGAHPQSDEGVWLLDLSSSLTSGILAPGETSGVSTVTIVNPAWARTQFAHGVYTLPFPNSVPEINSQPPAVAAIGELYEYQIAASDPDGNPLSYLLYDGPTGMSLDPVHGRLSWTPDGQSPADAPVVLRVYDSRGSFAVQSFSLAVAGGNHAPRIGMLPAEITIGEGQPLFLPLSVGDFDGDALLVWADHLPPGATFDQELNALMWVPAFDAAGTYPDVRFFASDRKQEVSAATTIRVTPTNQPPQLIVPEQVTIREGEPFRLRLQGSDPDGDKLTFYSHLLPAGAVVHPETGWLTWTPSYISAGEYELPLVASDGTHETVTQLTITVLNVNAPPDFGSVSAQQVAEGQVLQFRIFAFDPDNPGYVPPVRMGNGELVQLDDFPSTVTYQALALPPGASFDAETSLFTWLPDHTAAGMHSVTVLATDDGDGTGLPLSTEVTVPIRVININGRPVFTQVENATVQRDTVVDIPIAADDPEGNPLTMTIDGLPGYGLPQFMTFLPQGNGRAILRVAARDGDRGDYPITLTATDDGDGGQSLPLMSEMTFIVTVDAPNERPRMEHIGDKVALIGQPLEFTIRVSDPDQEPLQFTTSGLPAGATLTQQAVYGTALLRWTPSAADAGSHSVTFTVTDAGNGDVSRALSDSQIINLVVRQTNTAPTLDAVGNRTVDEGQPLTIQLVGHDADGDALTYAATNLPPGATLDAASGVLRWTPNRFQAGSYPNMVLQASDGQASATETITITVANVNQPPILTPLPRQSGRENEELQFTVAASDPDGEPVALSVTGRPTGARFEPRTGRFSWTPGFEQAGTYTLRFSGKDPHGATHQIDVYLDIDNVNRPPVLEVSSHLAVAEVPLAFRISGVDPDQDTVLTFAAEGLPEGATLDAATGEVNWTPGPGQLGDYTVVYSVSDGLAHVTQAAILRAVLEAGLPDVAIELTPSFPGLPGHAVLIHPTADSLSGIASLTVTVNGQPLALDHLGRAKYTPTAPGKYVVAVTAVDRDGHVGHATTTIKVRNPADTQPPLVAFAPQLQGGVIRTRTNIVASVEDLDLDSWTLEISPRSRDQWQPLGSGEVAGANQTLASIDPATLSNGFYRLRLTARDIAGRTSRAETLVEVNSADKSAAYVRRETDLSVVFGGSTIELVRTYDSLERAKSSSFGYGWRLAGFDFAIETDAGDSDRAALGVFQPYRVGTRLYATLPDGHRVGFTFTPQPVSQTGLTYYRPQWTSDAGVPYTLESADALLSIAGNRLYELKTAVGYNPASGLFEQPSFRLTGPDGTTYELNHKGQARAWINAQGERFIVSDSAVVGPDGEYVQIMRDAQRRITSLVAPGGQRVIYLYDTAGNLVSARQLQTGQGTRYGYDVEDRNLLTVAASLGGGGAVVSYGSAIDVQPLAADLGVADRFHGNPTHGSLSVGETHRYAFTLRSSELASTASGRMLLGVFVTASAGSLLEPAVPTVPGLTPLASRQSGTQAMALFAVDSERLQYLEVRGASGLTAGGYDLDLVVLGDVNQDGLVDGMDVELQQAAAGRSAGDPLYVLAADLNRDGVINATDAQLLASNYGFRVNRPPQVQAGTAKTHEDLEVTIPLDGLAVDAEGDAIYFRITASPHGTVTLSRDGQSVIFVPAAGFHGDTLIEFVADDGYSSSAVATLAVHISDAPLIGLDFVQRNPRLAIGELTDLVMIGNFADQFGVMLPASYLTFQSTSPSVALVSPSGQLMGMGNGSATILAQRAGIVAATAIGVGQPSGQKDVFLYAFGLNGYPEAVSLSADGGQRQLIVTIDQQQNLTASGTGTRYHVSNSSVLSVSPEGLITGKAPGVATVTAINGPAEVVIAVLVETPRGGAVVVGAEGGGSDR